MSGASVAQRPSPPRLRKSGSTVAPPRGKHPNLIGRYQLVCELAQSYLGELWAVRVGSGEGEGLVAAVRRVTTGESGGQELVDRLAEGAWTAMEIQHDWIPNVVDVVVSEGEIGVVSDYTEGLPLRGVCRQATIWRKPTPPGVALRIGSDVLEALNELHHQAEEFGELGKQVYGGVTPDSVLLGADGHAHLMDIVVAGVAATVPALRDDPERVAYAAPEQLGAEGDPDARTDLFCVGILIWEMLANRRLFVGFGESAAQKVLLQKIPPLNEIKRAGDVALPAALVDLVARTLDRNPSNRPQSAEEMLQAIRNLEVPIANPTEAASFLEQVAERDLTRQRNELALERGEAPSRRLSLRFKSVRPPGMPVPRAGAPPTRQEAAAAKPAAVSPKPTNGAPKPAAASPKPAAASPKPAEVTPKPAEAGPPQPPPLRREPKPTLLGIAPPQADPPRPRAASHPGVAAEIKPAATTEMGGAAVGPPPPPVREGTKGPERKPTMLGIAPVSQPGPGPEPEVPPDQKPGTPPDASDAEPASLTDFAVTLDSPSVEPQATEGPSPDAESPQQEPAPNAARPKGARQDATTPEQPKAKRRRAIAKETLLGVAPPAAGSHSPSLPDGPSAAEIAAALGRPVVKETNEPETASHEPMPGLRDEEEPTAVLSPTQLPWMTETAKALANADAQGAGAEPVDLDKIGRTVRDSLPSDAEWSDEGPDVPGPKTDVDQLVPGGEAIAAAIAEVAADAPAVAEAQTSSSEAVDDKVAGTDTAPPLLHEKKLDQVVAPTPVASSRFGIGFLAGVGTTLGSVGIGALVVALMGVKLGGVEGHETTPSAAAEPSSVAVAPSTKPATSAAPSASAASSATPVASAEEPDAGEEPDAAASASAAARPAPQPPPRYVPRRRPRPRSTKPKYVPDDI
jgi:serine/threonine-protein kinase